MPTQPHIPLEKNPNLLFEAEEAALFHHTALPQTAPSKVLDGILIFLGKGFSWLWLAVVAVILYSVISRYAFGQGSVTLEEVQWHLAAAAWLVGLSYTLVMDDHVRVDVLHERFGLKTQAWIEIFGLVVLLLPFLLISLWECIPYFWSSFTQNERSQAPAGLPARWVLKFFLPLTFALLSIAALSRLFKCTALLFGFPRPLLPATKTTPETAE